MKCPHCLVEFHEQREITLVANDIDGEWAIESYICPNPKCKKAILYLLNGEFQQHSRSGKWYVINSAQGHEIIAKRE